MMLDDVVRLIRQHRDEQAHYQPWRAWAHKNQVRLELSHYAPPATIYVLSPGITDGHTVVASPQTWKACVALVRQHAPDVHEQEIAEFIAWSKIPLMEPSDR